MSGEGAISLLTLALTAKVAASPRRVWRVLMSPAAAAHWLPNHEGWIDAPPPVFVPLCPLRFRSRMNRLPVNAEARLLEARPGRARVQLRLGLFAFEARFAIGREAGDGGGSRVGLVASFANEVPVVSNSLDRFAVKRLASQLAEQTLAALAQQAEYAETTADAEDSN